MLTRITGGNDGIKPYLETGHKDGRDFTRDELDERVVLAGDLEVTDSIIQSIDSVGDRYLHVTLSFKEDHLPPEVLHQVASEFEAFAFAAYRPDEYSFYAEAHLPKIKSYTNQRTGEFVERKPHIHIVIPDRNLLSGRPLNLFGKSTQQERFIDAFQEHINNKFGLASPKDHRRVEFTNASEMISRYKGDAFTGSSAALRTVLLTSLIERDITTVKEFRTLLSEHGDVRVRNEGKAAEYCNLKPLGSKGVNLKDYVFSRDFIELSQSEKRATIAREVKRQYDEAGAARRDPVVIEEALREWAAIRAKEVKYLNSGNVKFYREYRNSDRELQLAIIADREARYYAKHDKEHADGQHQRSHLERIGDNLRAASSDLESVGRSARSLDRGARKLADRSAIRAVAAAVRRHQGHQAKLGPRRPEQQRRQVDNMIGQLQHAQGEKSRVRSAGDRVDMAEIKRSLDARRLLSTLGASHGLLAEKYEVTKGKDGGDRITCGSRHLNVSDFLTVEMKLPWSDAEKILRSEHIQQHENAPARNVPIEPSKSPLWGDFQQWKKELPLHRAGAWDSQRSGEKSRRDANAKAFHARKGELHNNSALTHAKRRASLSVLRMEKIQADKALAAAIKAEREELKAQYQVKSSELFRVYLQARAGSGDALALAELRRQRTEPEHADGRGAQLVSGKEHNGRGRDVLEQGGATSYRVERNGDVTYRMADRDVLRDEARAVKVLAPQDREVLETGLRLALQKFGPRIDVKGSDEFKRQVVQTAMETGLRVEFADPELQAYRSKLEQQQRVPTPPAKPVHPVAGQQVKVGQEQQDKVYDAIAELRKRAREVDLPAWLAARGERIEKNGTKEFKLRQGDGEALRLFRSDKDGTWLVHDGRRTHDPIGFLQERDRVSFQEAVQQLADERVPAVQPLAPPVPAAPAAALQLRQARAQERDAAMAYVEARGISRATIEEARQQGFMAFDNRGPVFIGRDSAGAIRSAETRLLVPFKTGGGDVLTKVSYRGSDKAYSPILRGGEGTREVHLVEGGISALALRDIHRRERPNEPLPTIVVTGGARTVRWRDNPEVAQLLRQAERVSIHKENERDEHGRPDPKTQADTDAAHAGQWRAVAALRSGDDGLHFERPAVEFKDLAERNAHELKAREQAAAEPDEDDRPRFI